MRWEIVWCWCMLFASDHWPRNGPLISPCITHTFEPLQMWCPPTNCKILANPYTGTGFVGARRSFAFCYNPATNATTSAVWTGFLTNVTPPAGWAEEPADCTLQEYSQCNTNGDCTLAISPSPSCSCYVKSSFHPSYWAFHPEDRTIWLQFGWMPWWRMQNTAWWYVGKPHRQAALRTNQWLTHS